MTITSEQELKVDLFKKGTFPQHALTRAYMLFPALLPHESIHKPFAFPFYINRLYQALAHRMVGIPKSPTLSRLEGQTEVAHSPGSMNLGRLTGIHATDRVRV
jgi:hypothetical protein